MDNNDDLIILDPAPAQDDKARLAGLTKIENNEEFAEILGIIFLRGLDEINKILNGAMTLHLYDAKTSPYVQEIANMFDIDIQGEQPEVVQALLQYPIFSKALIGTQFGATEVLKPIMSNLEFKTHDNAPDMEPYNFIVRADNTIGLDQKKAASLVNRFACLRDNAAQIILIDIICDKPFTIVEKMFVKQKRTYHIDKGVC